VPLYRATDAEDPQDYLFNPAQRNVTLDVDGGSMCFRVRLPDERMPSDDTELKRRKTDDYLWFEAAKSKGYSLLVRDELPALDAKQPRRETAPITHITVDRQPAGRHKYRMTVSYCGPRLALRPEQRYLVFSFTLYTLTWQTLWEIAG
jgi:hypothetical protein